MGYVVAVTVICVAVFQVIRVHVARAEQISFWSVEWLYAKTTKGKRLRTLALIWLLISGLMILAVTLACFHAR